MVEGEDELRRSPGFVRRVAEGLGRRGADAGARVARLLGAGPLMPRSCRRILVLCDGNLCRSPFAEALLRARLEDTQRARDETAMVVESAGLHAGLGDPAPEAARTAALAHGVSLDAHRSRPIVLAMVELADLIVVMDLGQKERLVTAFPRAARKVELLARFDPDRSASPQIPDPMFGNADLFLRVYGRIAAAVAGLVHVLDSAASRR